MAETNVLYPFSMKFWIVMLVYFAGFYKINPVLAQKLKNVSIMTQ